MGLMNGAETVRFEFDAKFKKEEFTDGSIYVFFCSVSGAAVHTTGLICAGDKETELAIAKQEAQPYFNRCEECGKWIGDSVYNIDEAKCILCAPFTVCGERKE
jgi:hypothetical protein